MNGIISGSTGWKKQKYYASREIRLSIAVITIAALFPLVFFTFFAKWLSLIVGQGIPLLLFVFAGYAGIIFLISAIFSRRLLGPFQRLNDELKLIRSGNRHRRLFVRGSDDIYINSFIVEVNAFLDEYEQCMDLNDEILATATRQTLLIMSELSRATSNRDGLRQLVLQFHERVELLRRGQQTTTDLLQASGHVRETSGYTPQ
ncbi:MAG: hypothetical protein ISR96_10760 [Nitrospira sp.]|nr:hypothetical protein [bacterium]MBL7049984.1 hypothetical protein [Nitrospira sp.]